MLAQSTLTEFYLVSALDDAIDAPDRALFPDGADGDAAFAEAEAEFINKFRVARETDCYEPVLRAGASPTMFKLRPLRGRIWDRLRDLDVGDRERAGLGVRLALVGVENLALSSLKPVKDPEYPTLGPMASEKVLQELHAISPALIVELAGEVASRSANPPKR